MPTLMVKQTLRTENKNKIKQKYCRQEQNLCISNGAMQDISYLQFKIYCFLIKSTVFKKSKNKIFPHRICETIMFYDLFLKYDQVSRFNV